MSTTRLRARVAIALSLALSPCAGCDPDDPCDPGYYEEHNTCYQLPSRTGKDGGRPRADGGGIEPDLDGGAVADSAATDPPAGDPYEGFGDACSEPSDCPAPLICAAPMLALCTRTNCLDDPARCPPDWTCFDTTGLSPDPSVTSVCLKL